MLRFSQAARGACRFSSALRKQSLPPASIALSKRFNSASSHSIPPSFAPPTTADVPIYDDLRRASVVGENFADIRTIDVRRNASNASAHLASFPTGNRKRISLNGRVTCGIQKRRTTRSLLSRGLATRAGDEKSAPAQASSASGSTKNGTEKVNKPPARLTWRDATKSPMKALRYANQLRIALFDWFKHMWVGAKLLAADVRVSSGILRRVAHGKELTRRERGFLIQTGVDLARLVPFSLFLIIPLAEFALPFALRIFPNMLPSQFQDNMKKEEDMKRQLKGRIEIAKYLRDVVEEKAKSIKTSSEDSELQQDAESLENFIDSIRSGKAVDSAEVSKFARLFNDEITIDGAARPQLVAMCKYMGLSPYGHDQFLRFKLRSRLNTIKRDDMQIMWEGGVNSLTDDEVVKACQDRGIQTMEAQNKDLREQLKDWLHLSRQREIPSSLLIMSRAFFYSEVDGIKETLGSLPEEVIMDVKQAAAAESGETTTAERLEEARRQAKLIEMESEAEERKEREEEEKRKKKEESEKLSVQDAAEEVASDEPAMVEAQKRDEKLKKEFFDEKAADGSPASEKASAEPAESPGEDEEERFQEQKDMRKLLVSLGELASESAVEKEREELIELKAELAEAEAIVKQSGESTGLDLRRFKSLVKKLEREVERVDAVVGLRMKLLDKDNDGLMSFEECKNIMGNIAGNPDDDLVTETLRRLDADADGNISRADLKRLLKEMQGDTSALGTSEDKN